MVKILAIDDDKSQLQLLRRILGERHYSVAFAQNEPDALELMERKRPLVVLSDLKIPGTDGVGSSQKGTNLGGGGGGMRQSPPSVLSRARVVELRVALN